MINIGEPPASDFTDPIGVLGDCHRRLERFLRLLIVVTQRARGCMLSAEQREALLDALRYFREAAPLHTADEEESLFPQLRTCGHKEVGQILTVLRTLERNHEDAVRWHGAVEDLGQRWLDEGQLSPDGFETLATHLRSLDALYRRHIAIEDGDVFPLARRVLTRSTCLALGRAMAQRRGLDLDALSVGVEYPVSE